VLHSGNETTSDTGPCEFQMLNAQSTAELDRFRRRWDRKFKGNVGSGTRRRVGLCAAASFNCSSFMTQSLREMLLLTEYAKRLIHSPPWLRRDASVKQILSGKWEIKEHGGARPTAWKSINFKLQVSAAGIFGATRKSRGRQVGQVKDQSV